MSAAWTPLWDQLEPEIGSAQPGGFHWPRPNHEGWIGPLHSPLREDRSPSFSVRPDSSTDPGGWRDHGTGDRGSIADLADRLGIDPRVSVSKDRSHDPEMTLEGFCRRRHLDEATLTLFRVREGRHRDRPALLFPTRGGPDRVKYLDGETPKCGWKRSGGCAHWYGLGQAKDISGEVLYVVNGEPSVWACSQSNVPALCTCAGEGVSPDGEMVRELRDAGFARVRVVFDRDGPGREGALAMVEHLRAAGLDAAALELPAHVGPHGDVDDLHRMAGDDGLAERLAELPELRPEDRTLDLLNRLGAVSSIASLDPLLRELKVSANGSDPIARGLLRERAIEALRSASAKVSSAKLIDAALGAVTSRNTDAATAPIVLADPEPWPEPVNGTELMNGLVTVLRRFLILPSGGAEAIALWAVHAHALPAAMISPILSFVSPVFRCGKTLALELIAGLVPRSLPSANITAAALFRGVEKFCPTLLIDEADTFLKKNDELRGVLNSGHRESSAFVLRCEGDNHEPTIFKTWCPKAIALIGSLPSTLEDRSLAIRMRRKAPGEQVERWRADHQPDLNPLCRQAARWTSDHIEELRASDPDVPEQLNDRAADNWRPLLAIADAVGGEWPSRAREAAVSLASGEPDAESWGVLLLHDMRALFDEHGSRLASSKIVECLSGMEERPWPEYRRGMPITVRQLARLLKPFGIAPAQYRDDQREKTRGYRSSDFEDTFARYLPIHPVHPVHNSEQRSYGESDPVQTSLVVPDGESRKSNENNDVPLVPDGTPPIREGASDAPDDLEEPEVAGGIRI